PGGARLHLTNPPCALLGAATYPAGSRGAMMPSPFGPLQRRGAGPSPIRGSRLNITDLVTQHARMRPDHPAIEDGGRVVTYAELDTRVDDAAANLQSLGIAPGDIVGVMLADSAEHLIVLLALARAGA